MKLEFKQTKYSLKESKGTKWAKKEEPKYFEVFIKQRMKSVSFTNWLELWEWKLVLVLLLNSIQEEIINLIPVLFILTLFQSQWVSTIVVGQGNLFTSV